MFHPIYRVLALAMLTASLPLAACDQEQEQVLVCDEEQEEHGSFVASEEFEESELIACEDDEDSEIVA